MKLNLRTLIISILLLTVGSAANEAWADVTYIILTKPFNVKKADGTEWHRENVRLEALRCTSTGTTVYLPDAFRSPLAKNFKYWKTPTVTTNTKFYDDTNTNPKVLQTRYDIYTAVADEMTESSTLESNSNPAIIYVTYDYDEDNTIMKLDGSQKYNVSLNSGNKLRFLGLNKNRANRPAAALATTVSAYDLISDDFVSNVNGFDGTKSVYYQFCFTGLDPYNITIMTAYNGNETYMEDLNVEKGTKYKKPFRGSTIFAKLNSSNNNDGTANMWLAPDAHKHYKSSTDETVYDSWEGFYRSDMDPIFNAVAVLPKGTGYFFIASKLNQNGTIYQPNGSGRYATLTDDGKNPRMIFKALNDAISVMPYPVTTYTFSVTTSFGNTIEETMEWSDVYKETEITTAHIPDNLKRKYCVYTFYKDAALTQEITKFSQAENSKIYVKYQVVGAPFTAITAANKTTGYTSATWYELTDAATTDGSKKIKWDATVYKNSGAKDVYEKESEFAFIGDPYELRIINRKLTADASANWYVGSTARTTGSDLTNNASDEGAGFKWEIPYDETVGSFTLREFGSTDAYWNWTTGSAGNNIQYSTSASTRIKTIELGKINCTFKIVDLAGNIAIQATQEVTPFDALNYSSIPAAIRSPFIADETITFYSTYSVGGRGNLSGDITEVPTTAGDIYVKYTTARLNTKSITLSEGQSFNVKLNGEYIYWDSSDGKIKSNASPADLTANEYLWRLRGRDPYAMLIDNLGATVSAHNSFDATETVTVYDDNGTSSSVSRYKGAWVKTSDGTWGDGKELVFNSDRAYAARFIAMLSNYAGVYEAMAATGTTDFYHIGRASESNAEAKIYSETTYAHGADQLHFVLEGTTIIQYHLIDRGGKEIFRNEISSKNARLALPPEYVSPLVANYRYYAEGDVTRTNGEDGVANTEDDNFTLNPSPTPLSEAGSNTSIYVFYDVVDFGFGSSYPRLLKFLKPTNYFLEDGADKLTTEKIPAVYPYFNGDGNLNIYGQPMNEEQMNGGSSTRPRWVWFLESGRNDPYHVKIRSRQNISFGGASHNAYIHTEAVHFKQDANENKQHIVTGAHYPVISGQQACEYMILGSTGRYKLVTTEKIAADLDGDGNTTGTGENEHRTVTSLEQYWKTYNMVKQHLLGFKKEIDDEYSTDVSTFEMPDSLRATLAAKLGAKGIGSANWHSYDAIANATRWNGYNDKSGKDGFGKKIIERLEHWFQTFDMGDGTFDIEDANIPAVLVLLDRHGWEIMRRPLPTSTTDPEKDEKLAALKAFDSPMVKEYKFWSKASKASGCHRYTGLGNAITTGSSSSTPFTSTSLADLPPLTGKNAKDNLGSLNDQFVTYTVREEYEKSYDPTTGEASKFLLLQNDKYAQDGSTGSITGNTVQTGGLSAMIINPDATADTNHDDNIDENNLWYAKPNSDIDTEMGYPNATLPTYTDEENGFDPYNLQLENVATNKYITTHLTASVLNKNNGIVYDGVYTGTGGSTNVTLEDKTTSVTAVASPESHDHSTLQMTNQTFMAVQDENRNMQLMPRFDYSRRVNVFTTLAAPLTEAENDHEGEQSTQLARPLVFNYRIIDNNGNTALRYRAAGEFYPEMPEHFKSPLATDFKYYFGHAIYKTPVASTAAAWNAAAEGAKKTATNESNMKAQALGLAAGDYYFQIFNYKAVEVTTGKSGNTDAKYNAATVSSASAWEKAGAFQKTAITDSDMTAQVKAMTTVGTYYFKIDNYKKVTVTNSNTTVSVEDSIADNTKRLDGFYAEQKAGKDLSAREITGSFTAADVQESSDIYIRYSYDESYDVDHDNILQGRWMTMKLADKDVQAHGTVVAGAGTGVSLHTGEKPSMSAESAHKWQWKFVQSPCVDTSSYYIAPDPYALKIYNRYANNDPNPINEPNMMATPIKVSGKDNFVLLSHPDDGYALAVASNELSYSFLNGASMTAPDAGSPIAASVVTDASFSTEPGYDIADAEKVEFVNDVITNYTYYIITNEGHLAASATQDQSTAQSNEFKPKVPESIKTPLLNEEDYQYFGTAGLTGSVYSIVKPTELKTLYGLYDDIVYVRYKPYNELKSPYKVPNVKGTEGGHVARGSSSNDTSLGLNANLLYNFIWYDDEMMENNGDAIQSTSNQALTSTAKFEWQLEGNDPYAIKIKSIGATSGDTKEYIHEVTATPGTTELSTDATTFMILNRDGYDYGVLAKTGTPVVGGNALMLSGHGNTLTTSDPTKVIIFALATYKVIYHLMIKPTGAPVIIPYRGPEESDVLDLKHKILDGSTQRDLVSGSPAGSTYQLGTNIYSILDSGERVIGDSLYCVDAGCISLGDVLKIPSELYRPNVVYRYFIEGVYNSDGTAHVNDMNNKYKGRERTTMGDDAGLLGKTVLVNIVYTFNGGLDTNKGEGFVMDPADNQWYTFETSGSNPYLTHYTYAGGLKTVTDRNTHYTNDYLWLPLGDPYGFKMYNRYTYKNNNQPSFVMTSPDLTNGTKLMMGKPGETAKPEGEGTVPAGNEIYELLASDVEGYFNVHPVANTEGSTVYIKRGSDDCLEISTAATPMTFGLDEAQFKPYYERAGYVGALTTTKDTGGKAKYEEAEKETNAFTKLIRLQKIVYNDDNIVPYAPGYYRLHSQPAASGLTTVRYASGYLHDMEKTGAPGMQPIPMHFYSRKGTSTTFEDEGGLGSGFTKTPATRGPIPVPATEYDPSTIFYISGNTTDSDGNPLSTLRTQDLYVKGNATDDDHGDAVMTATVGEATTFTILDIGAGVFLIHDGSAVGSRKYLNFSQDYKKTIEGVQVNFIYDMKYFKNSPLDDAKWCLEPANIQGLQVETNNGGDSHYYSTFYAPYDVLLPKDDGTKTYYAYICTEWTTDIVHPKMVPASGTYAEGKFVPAGTPVIIRTTDTTGKIKLELPNSSPSEPLSNCVFSGEYLEKMLTTPITDEDKVFTFGLPITGYGIYTGANGDGKLNGDITDVLNRNQENIGVAFYVNANPNKELSERNGEWAPNNRYVLHNKIYYRGTGGGGTGAKAAQFVPVNFDFEDEPIVEYDPEEGAMTSTGSTVKIELQGVYDMMGRKVVAAEEMSDNQWRQRLSPGLYIVNGRKMHIIGK